jgi:hypothetical protein
MSVTSHSLNHLKFSGVQLIKWKQGKVEFCPVISSDYKYTAKEEGNMF